MIRVREPPRNGSVRVNHQNYRMGDVVAVAADRIGFVDQSKGTNDFGLGVGEDRVLNFSTLGEAI